MNTAAIAQHLNIVESAIVRVEEWSKVLFVVARGIGARFVSKKVVKMSKAQVTRHTWEYGDNFNLLIDGEEVESWPTSEFMVGGFVATFAPKYGLKPEEVEISEDAKDWSVRPRRSMHDHEGAVHHFHGGAAWDPREQSGDFDPEELI